MPVLAIGYRLVPNVNGWVAVIQGTQPPIYRTFLVDAADAAAAPGGAAALAGNQASTDAVQRLASAMQQGQATVIAQENLIFEATAAGGGPVPDVLSLFTTTDKLTYAGEFVIEAFPEAEVGATTSLLEILEDAGERLALVMAG